MRTIIEKSSQIRIAFARIFSAALQEPFKKNSNAVCYSKTRETCSFWHKVCYFIRKQPNYRPKPGDARQHFFARDT